MAKCLQCKSFEENWKAQQWKHGHKDYEGLLIRGTRIVFIAHSNQFVL